MTIVSRRRIYWALFVIACLVFLAGLFLSLPIFQGRVDTELLKASGSFFREKIFALSVDSARTTAAAALFSGLYSVLCLGYILRSFRKTVSSEIFFFAFWALSIGLEALRPLAFRLASQGAPASLILVSTRLVLAGRAMGLLAFFCASLYAVGFHNEKLGSAAFVVVLLGCALAVIIPLNTGVYQTNLIVRPGYRGYTSLLAGIAGLAILADFIYASFSSGEAPYRIVALGSASALLGQALLITQWQPFALFLGFGLLALGSWLVVSRLHAYYLWQ